MCSELQNFSSREVRSSVVLCRVYVHIYVKRLLIPSDILVLVETHVDPKECKFLDQVVFWVGRGIGDVHIIWVS